MFVEESEGTDKFVDGDGLIAGISNCELGAGYQTRGKCQKEKHASDEEHLERRARGEGSVLCRTGSTRTPVDFERNRRRRNFWEGCGQQDVQRGQVISHDQYNI